MSGLLRIMVEEPARHYHAPMNTTLSPIAFRAAVAADIPVIVALVE